jgi:hypothetical protein
MVKKQLNRKMRNELKRLDSLSDMVIKARKHKKALPRKLKDIEQLLSVANKNSGNYKRLYYHFTNLKQQLNLR